MSGKLPLLTVLYTPLCQLTIWTTPLHMNTNILMNQKCQNLNLDQNLNLRMKNPTAPTDGSKTKILNGNTNIPLNPHLRMMRMKNTSISTLRLTTIMENPELERTKMIDCMITEQNAGLTRMKSPIPRHHHFQESDGRYAALHNQDKDLDNQDAAPHRQDKVLHSHDKGFHSQDKALYNQEAALHNPQSVTKVEARTKTKNKSKEKDTTIPGTMQSYSPPHPSNVTNAEVTQTIPKANAAPHISSLARMKALLGDPNKPTVFMTYLPSFLPSSRLVRRMT